MHSLKRQPNRGRIKQKTIHTVISGCARHTVARSQLTGATFFESGSALVICWEMLYSVLVVLEYNHKSLCFQRTHSYYLSVCVH